MNRENVTPSQWELIREVSLGLRGRVSHNTIRQLMFFAEQVSTTGALRDWIMRLSNLGETYASGSRDRRSRQALNEVLLPKLRRNMGEDWALILGWVARYLYPDRS